MNEIEKKVITNIIDNICIKYKGEKNTKIVRIGMGNNLINYFPLNLSKFELNYDNEECIYDMYRYMITILSELLTEHRNKIIDNII